MPIHDLGYRRWKGRLTPVALRWWVITETAMQLAWSSRFLRRIVFLAWLSTAYAGAMFFAFEQSSSRPEWRASVISFIGYWNNLPQEQVAKLALADMGEVRHQVWANLLLILFRHPQGVALLVMVGLIAPPLIANDIRSRAFLLYFSRPIGRLEYIIGKAATILAYGCTITLLPGLLCYVLAVLFSPDLSVVKDTWDLPLRTVGATFVLMIPATLLSLAFSSLAKESRYASFAWFASWGLGWAAYTVLTAQATFQDQTAINSQAGRATLPDFTLFSLYHTLGSIQGWVFGTGASLHDIWQEVALIVAITIVSLLILFRRVSAPMRA